MRIKTQKDAEHAEIAELLSDCKVMTFTRPGEAGVLRSRPLTPLELDANGTLWFLVDRQSMYVDDLLTVNLSASDPEHGVFLSLGVLSVRITSAQIWDGPHSKTARILARAASLAARRPIGLGTHRMMTC
jgi:general stress protein 26